MIIIHVKYNILIRHVVVMPPSGRSRSIIFYPSLARRREEERVLE
jgi:hypothetical protein